MRRKIRLVLLFYRSRAAAELSVTAVCALTLWRTGPAMVPLLLLFKAGTWVLFLLAEREWGAGRMVYFTNLGLSPRALRGWSTALDGAVFVLCLTAVFLCKAM